MLVTLSCIHDFYICVDFCLSDFQMPSDSELTAEEKTVSIIFLFHKFLVYMS
jgi:hypothetical protein